MKSSRLQEIRQCAKTAGVTILAVEQHRKHIQVTLSNGRKVFTSMTPSDWRAGRKFICDLKKEASHER